MRSMGQGGFGIWRRKGWIGENGWYSMDKGLLWRWFWLPEKNLKEPPNDKKFLNLHRVTAKAFMVFD